MINALIVDDDMATVEIVLPHRKNIQFSPYQKRLLEGVKAIHERIQWKASG